MNVCSKKGSHVVVPFHDAMIECLVHDPIDESVVQRFLRSEKLIALGIQLHLIHIASGVLRNEFIERVLHLHDVFRVDRDIRRLAFRATERLVNHDFGMFQGKSLSLLSAHENDRSAAGRHTEADRGDIGFDVLHGVVHRHRRGHLAAGRIDVEGDVLLRILFFQKEKLRDDRIGDVIVDRSAEEHDALFQQARVDVIHSFAKLRLFYDGGDDEVLRGDRTASDAFVDGLNAGVHEEGRKECRVES